MIRHHEARLRLLIWLGLFALLPVLGGCTLLGVAAAKVIPEPSKTEPVAMYKGMKGQTCAVMVYADFAAKTDFPYLRIDVGKCVQAKIEAEGRDLLSRSELAGVKFPYPAASVVRFQEEHADTANQPITTVARRLGIPNLSRLIYVEVHSFNTRYGRSEHLFRGAAKVSLKVLEIAGDEVKIGFQEDNIRVLYPSGGADALAASEDVNDQTMYLGTVATIADELSRRFYEPPEAK